MDGTGNKVFISTNGVFSKERGDGRPSSQPIPEDENPVVFEQKEVREMVQSQ